MIRRFKKSKWEQQAPLAKAVSSPGGGILAKLDLGEGRKYLLFARRHRRGNEGERRYVNYYSAAEYLDGKLVWQTKDSQSREKIEQEVETHEAARETKSP